jgi:hypothetical protein
MLGLRRMPAVPVVAALAGLALAGAAFAAPFDYNLSFGSLPSAQGWTYAAVGSHAGVAEPSAFSVAGGVLTQNTIGQYAGTSGGSILYSIVGVATATETKRIHARLRCLAVQGSSVATLGQGGLTFGFNTGSVQYAFGLTDTRLTILQPGGTSVLAGSYDNTQFHDYDFYWSPGGTFQLYRDNVLITSGSGGFAASGSRLFFGDGTGGANAHGEITALRFSQDLATPGLPASWGRIKNLFR